jgi:subfamily B ATP-binding cassette protein MsbA
VLLFIYGGRQIIDGYITSGEFVFFMLIVLNLFDPVKMISNSINGTKAGEAASVRILKILDAAPEDFTSGTEGTFKDRIRFDNVSFGYNDNDVLRNINITIPKGKTAAIVGVSGSGKSTMLNMISAFYRPTGGAILIDSTDEKDLSLDWIRSKISIVTQEVFLFHDTILENITCGNNYPMEKVIEASKIAHAHDFISKLPEGYNSIVGERGFMLSGGERQRISIARAILSDPEIILFDEATSALDYESEMIIQDSLRYLFKGRTSIVVSHRLSTIQDADIIYFLKNGVIADCGTHAELLERSDGYRMLFSAEGAS